jgi:hypothetical protein
MGTLDRIIRLVAVAAVIGAYGLGLIGGTLALVLGAVAVALLLTSLTATRQRKPVAATPQETCGSASANAVGPLARSASRSPCRAN